ncbi:hydrolase [Alteromonas sp. 14N.309.X.WAT.G.H12]|uniref:hydrolase n=1 Tax=Alteromonas sp. 14N.309.X.WAT.G.H12 TaxID=3120824 RepID=UPI002FD31D30
MALPDHGHGVVQRSAFTPPRWAQNPHIQTIWPRFVQKRQPVHFRWERIETEDGDFVDLAWGPVPASLSGLVVMFHGLEGSIRSHYAIDTMAALSAQGWQVVMMHFRGCSGEVNRTPRAYHSGDTQDAVYILELLHQRFPGLPKVAIGFSLGGNMLLKLLGEQPDQPWLEAAMAVSPPMKLDVCSTSINQGSSRFYQGYLIRSMKKTLMKKMAMMDYGSLIDLNVEQVKKLRTFRQFDDKVTAPLHGFADALDYYEKCSAFRYLGAIHCPTLIIHSLDDPFMSPQIVPQASDLSPRVTLELSEFGGHVGFMQGDIRNPTVWHPQRAIDYFTPYLSAKGEIL